MRAMLLERPAPVTQSPLRECDLPDPQPGGGELLLDVAACGICRTDLQICEGDLAARVLPVVPGHQIVGRIAAVGPGVGVGVGAWRVGDRVGVGWLGATDGTCPQCLVGRENLCAEAAFTGWDRFGGYATRVCVKADFAFGIPAHFSDTDAAPLLCGGVIGYRSLKRSGIRPGGALGLYGFGASALLALQIAKHWGCRVYVCTRSPVEQARALAMGADWAGDYRTPPPVPLDAAVTFAPSGDVVRAALRALDRGGMVAVNAIHLDRVPELPYEELWWERGIVSVANFTRQDARELLDLAASIPLRTSYETYPLASANVALARLRAGEVQGAAVLVTA